MKSSQKVKCYAHTYKSVTLKDLAYETVTLKSYDSEQSYYSPSHAPTWFDSRYRYRSANSK